MATNAYITLTNSDASLSKRFKVIESGYSVTIEKSQNVRKTISGSLDISTGGIYEIHSYTIKVYDEVSDVNYGTRHDLETFFRYNNPNGTPSNLITMIDHFGDSHTVVMDGNFTHEALGAVIEGTNAVFLVQCMFRVIPGGS